MLEKVATVQRWHNEFIPSLWETKDLANDMHKLHREIVSSQSVVSDIAYEIVPGAPRDVVGS